MCRLVDSEVYLGLSCWLVCASRPTQTYVVYGCSMLRILHHGRMSIAYYLWPGILHFSDGLDMNVRCKAGLVAELVDFLPRYRLHCIHDILGSRPMQSLDSDN